MQGLPNGSTITEDEHMNERCVAQRMIICNNNNVIIICYIWDYTPLQCLVYSTYFEPSENDGGSSGFYITAF